MEDSQEKKMPRFNIQLADLNSKEELKARLMKIIADKKQASQEKSGRS